MQVASFSVQLKCGHKQVRHDYDTSSCDTRTTLEKRIIIISGIVLVTTALRCTNVNSSISTVCYHHLKGGGYNIQFYYIRGPSGDENKMFALLRALHIV